LSLLGATSRSLVPITKEKHPSASRVFLLVLPRGYLRDTSRDLRIALETSTFKPFEFLLSGSRILQIAIKAR